MQKAASDKEQFEDVFDKFKRLDTSGYSNTVSGKDLAKDTRTVPTTCRTAHQHPISCLRAYSTKGSGSDSNVSTLSTSALDGKILLWDVKAPLGQCLQSGCMSTVTTLVNRAPKVLQDGQSV